MYDALQLRLVSICIFYVTLAIGDCWTQIFFFHCILAWCSEPSLNLKQVAQIAVRAALQSSGQNCAGAERFYVHKDVYTSFVAEVVKIVKSVTAVSTIFQYILYVTSLCFSLKSW